MRPRDKWRQLTQFNALFTYVDPVAGGSSYTARFACDNTQVNAGTENVIEYIIIMNNAEAFHLMLFYYKSKTNAMHD